MFLLQLFISPDAAVKTKITKIGGAHKYQSYYKNCVSAFMTHSVGLYKTMRERNIHCVSKNNVDRQH